MPDTHARVQAIVDRFVSELSTVAREEAARIVLEGFGGPRSKGRGVISNGAGRSAKRDAQNLQALQGKLLAFVKAHPGLRIEQINAELGTSTKDVALPIKKLIASKQLRTEGQRRSTKYYAEPAKTVKGAARTKSGKRSR